MESSFENFKLHANFSPYESNFFDRLKLEYLALLDGQTYEYYTEKKDLRRQTELNKKMNQINLFYSQPEKRVEMIPAEVYVEAMGKVFGEGNLELMDLPDPEDLDKAYFEDKYPKFQRQADKERGLICVREEWNDEESYFPGGLTWCQTFLQAMRAEMEKLKAEGYTKIATETIQKPDYNDDQLLREWQYYGSKDGKNRGLDPVVPLIEESMGIGWLSRYGLSWEKINEKIIPAVKKEILIEFKKQGLPMPDFKVICTPASVSRELMEQHPELSQTTTSEWTSTPLLTQYNKVFDFMVVGGSRHGGAGDLSFKKKKMDLWVGFRLSVLFKQK